MRMVDNAHAAFVIAAAQIERGTRLDSLTVGEEKVLVKAVLKALREPTPAMVDAGAELCDAAYSGKAVHAAWQAMIDAALDGEG